MCKWKTPWINPSHIFMADLLVTARNGRKCRSGRKECDGKGRTSQKEEWGTRKVAAGGANKAEVGGKLGKRGQLT